MFFKCAVKNASSVFKYPAALPATVKAVLSVAIIVSASTVMVAINTSQKDTQTKHLFFIANVMFANIMAVTMRNIVAYAAILKVTNPDINLIRCKALGVGTFPVAASFLMVVALCLDRMFTVIAPGTYKKVMTKTFAWTIVIIVWIISCIVTYAGLSNCPLADLKDGTCNTGYFEQFEVKAVILPMVLSGILAAIHNVFIFYKVFITTPLNKSSKQYKFARLYKAWRIHRETQPISVTLLILGGYNITTSIILIAIQTHTGGFLQEAMMSFCAYNIINISMLIHSLLYIKFLHTIKERLWFKCKQ